MQNWQSGVCSGCGNHLSHQAEAAYQPGYLTCKSCGALQTAQEKQKAVDKPLIEQGHNPDRARRWFVHELSAEEVQEAIRKAEEASGAVERKSAQEQLDEFLAQAQQD